MISEHVTVEVDGRTLSGRFGAAAQGHLKALPKSDTKKHQNYAKPQAETMHLRMIDLNLFRVFVRRFACRTLQLWLLFSN